MNLRILTLISLLLVCFMGCGRHKTVCIVGDVRVQISYNEPDSEIGNVEITNLGKKEFSIHGTFRNKPGKDILFDKNTLQPGETAACKMIDMVTGFTLSTSRSPDTLTFFIENP